MKYIVMECHDAYAVLMDEASCFVKAANLHYTVGQTVTEPVLMEESSKKAASPVIIMRRVGALAACAALVAAGGYQYYAKNLKASSVVTIETETKFSMGINSKGEVVYLTSEGDSGADILEDFDAKGKDQLTVANELLERELSKGYLAGGDSVEVVIDTKDTTEYDVLKNDLEKGIAELHLNANVVSKGEPPKPDTKLEPPMEAHEAAEHPETPPEPIKPQETHTPPTLPDAEKPKPVEEQKPIGGQEGGQKPPVKPPKEETGTAPIPPTEVEPPMKTGSEPPAIEPPAPLEPNGEKPEVPTEPPMESKPIEPPHAHQPQVIEPREEAIAAPNPEESIEK